MEKYLQALASLNWETAIEGTRKEARRQAGQMDKWLKLAEDLELEELSAFPILREVIKKANKYQFRIYNRNATMKSLKEGVNSRNNKVLAGASTEDAERYNAEAMKMMDEYGELEAEQFMLAGRIFKIYCFVSGHVNLLVTRKDFEQDDQESNDWE